MAPLSAGAGMSGANHLVAYLVLLGWLGLAAFAIGSTVRARSQPDSRPPALAGGRSLFVVGTLGCVAGFLLHLQMFVDAAPMHYHMVGMSTGGDMFVGMTLLAGGLAMAFAGLVIASPPRREATPANFVALDEAPLTRRHWLVLITLALAVVIDLMKTTTLSFVTPGVSLEYGLKSAANPIGHGPVSVLALAGLIGTVVGSLVWGWMADRLGRRSSMLFASLVFVATATCGAMPTFHWNVAMCLVMGFGAGGMLPIAYSLLIEIIPTRHRGWLVIVIGGNTAGAFALTSWLAGELEPHFTWRILWLIGAPTGLILIALSRLIPESPRFLLATGRVDEAYATMRRLSIRAEPSTTFTTSAAPRPISASTCVVCALALAAGVLQFGFQFWMPTNLQHVGYSAQQTDFMLRNAALLGAPATALVAVGYGLWNAKWTVLILSAVTGAAVALFGLLPDDQLHRTAVATTLLVVPLAGISALGAAVIVYAAETAETANRGRITGLTASASKLGGLGIIAWSTLGLTPPTISAMAEIGLVPLVLAAFAFARLGRNTTGVALERAEVVSAAA